MQSCAITKAPHLRHQGTNREKRINTILEVWASDLDNNKNHTATKHLHSHKPTPLSTRGTCKRNSEVMLTSTVGLSPGMRRKKCLEMDYRRRDVNLLP